MKTGRLEAFSDGVIAIIITIMVLEMHAPHEPTLAAIKPLIPVFLSYILSFIFVGLYWNNHHHLLHAAEHVTGGVLWANLHLLFWLSLVPFVTAWMGENHFAPVPVALYGVVLLGAAVAYYALVRVLLAHHGRESDLARALRNKLKEKISIVIYVVGIIAALKLPLVACACYIAVTVMWLVPDSRIEKRMSEGKAADQA